MAYRRGYDDYNRGYDRRGFGGGGGGWDDGHRGRDDYRGHRDDRGWDRRGSGGGGGGGRWGDDRRDRDRSFGGGGRGGRDRDRDRSFNRRGGGGGGGGGRGGFKRPGGDRGGPPQGGVKKFRDEMDDNWMEDDRHPLMQASFMETKPEDLGEDWFFVVCPHGKRRILVAANEITQSYNNGGIPGSKFKSCLPSGSPLLKEVHKADDLTIFDAIFCGEEKKFYIIDLLHWKHYPYYETEADFRFFCLTEKFSHLDKPSEITSDNEYGLELLPKVSWTESGFKEALEKAKDDSLKVEGVLFIHKTTLYDTQSDTPGCQWLRLDKMESIFGFATPEGLDFVVSNSKDDKKKKEQEEMKKVKEQRDAAIEEAKRDLEKSEDGVKEEGDYEIEGENYGEGKDEEEAHGDEGEGHNAGGEEGDYGGEGYGDQSGGYNDYTADTDEGVWKG